MTHHTFMQKLDSTLIRSHIGEAFALTFGGGSAILDAIGWITPIVGLIGALLGVAAGVYTFKLKRLEYNRAIERRKSR